MEANAQGRFTKWLRYGPRLLAGVIGIGVGLYVAFKFIVPVTFGAGAAVGHWFARFLFSL